MQAEVGLSPTSWAGIVGAFGVAIGILWRALMALIASANARVDLAHENEIKRLMTAQELMSKQYELRIQVAESYAEKFMNLAFKTTGLAEDNLRLVKQKLIGE